MAIDPASVAAGALVGAVTSEAFEKSKDKAADVSGRALPQHGHTEDEILTILVAEILEHLKGTEGTCKPQNEAVTLFLGPFDPNGTSRLPYRFKHLEFKRHTLWTATAFNVVIQHGKFGTAQFAMNVGWNKFDMPNDSDVYIAAGGPASVPVIIHRGDDSLA